MSGGRPPKFKSVEELKNAIDLYFLSCEDPEKPGVYIRPLTITGLANALDTNRQTLLNYEEKDEYFDTIKRAKCKVEQYVEEYMFTGKNQTGAIFNAKNNFGWKDKSEQDITSGGEQLQPLLVRFINDEQTDSD
jgi:hypothetical protein